MGQLERQEDYKEEQFDYIQQTLRTVCLKYGAALFYTTTGLPQSFPSLRSYIMHRLLHTSTKPFPFYSRAQVIERDTVLVPAGWDSWSKIKILRGFDCEGVSRGWDIDMGLGPNDYVEGDEKVAGTRSVYEEVVRGRKEDTQIVLHPPTKWEDEQLFYEKHYETLQRTSDNSRVPGAPASHTTSTGMTLPGVIGPMGVPATTLGFTSIFGNGTDLETDEVTTKLGRLARKDPGNNKSGSPPSPTGSTAVGNPGASNEVLANFFQSLLSKKNASTGGSGGGSVGSSTSPNGSSANLPPSTASPGKASKDVAKELERMRMQGAANK